MCIATFAIGAQQAEDVSLFTLHVAAHQTYALTRLQDPVLKWLCGGTSTSRLVSRPDMHTSARVSHLHAVHVNDVVPTTSVSDACISAASPGLIDPAHMLDRRRAT